MDGGSRWGIKGSSEISDGLNAVYRFEHNISTNDGSQSGGRLAYAGLSGGFGTVTLGQIWNAAYNHVGSITDGSWHFGDAHTGYRHGNAVSYSFSGGAMSMQLDAIMDGGMTTDSEIDKLEFGLTIDLGDIGKVALAHTNQKDTMKSMTFVTQEAVAAVPATYRVITTAATDDAEAVLGNAAHMISVKIAKNSNSNLEGDDDSATGRTLNQSGANAIVRTEPTAGMYEYSVGQCGVLTGDDAGNDECITVNAFVSMTSPSSGGGTSQIDYHIAGEAATNVHEVTAMIPAIEEMTENRTVVDVAGHKKNHIAVQIGVGGLTTYLGHSTIEKNGASAKDKITHYGVSGGIGDTGISFHAMGRSKKLANGKKKSPWLLGFTKGLGGGATAYIEHANDESRESGKAATRLGLKVDF